MKPLCSNLQDATCTPSTWSRLSAIKIPFMLNLQTWLSLAHNVGAEMDGHPVSVDTNFGAHEEAMQKYLKE